MLTRVIGEGRRTAELALLAAELAAADADDAPAAPAGQ